MGKKISTGRAEDGAGDILLGAEASGDDDDDEGVADTLPTLDEDASDDEEDDLDDELSAFELRTADAVNAADAVGKILGIITQVRSFL